MAKDKATAAATTDIPPLRKSLTDAADKVSDAMRGETNGPTKNKFVQQRSALKNAARLLEEVGL